MFFLKYLFRFFDKKPVFISMSTPSNITFLKFVLFVATIFLGIFTLVVHSQSTKASFEKEKKLKRQKRNKLFIAFCFFLFAFLVIFTRKPQSVNRQETRTNPYVSASAVPEAKPTTPPSAASEAASKAQLIIPLPSAASASEEVFEAQPIITLPSAVSDEQPDTQPDAQKFTKQKLEIGQTEECNIQIQNFYGNKDRDITLFRSCCNSKSKSTEFMVYSPPPDYSYVIANNTTNKNVQARSLFDGTDEKGTVKIIKYDSNKKWIDAVYVTGLKQNGIHIPFLAKNGDDDNWYIPTVSSLGILDKDVEMMAISRRPAQSSAVKNFQSEILEEYKNNNSLSTEETHHFDNLYKNAILIGACHPN